MIGRLFGKVIVPRCYRHSKLILHPWRSTVEIRLRGKSLLSMEGGRKRGPTDTNTLSMCSQSVFSLPELALPLDQMMQAKKSPLSPPGPVIPAWWAPQCAIYSRYIQPHHSTHPTKRTHRLVSKQCTVKHIEALYSHLLWMMQYSTFKEHLNIKWIFEWRSVVINNTLVR